MVPEFIARWPILVFLDANKDLATPEHASFLDLSRQTKQTSQSGAITLTTCLMTPLAGCWPPGAAVLSKEEGPKPDLGRHQCSTQHPYRSMLAMQQQQQQLNCNKSPLPLQGRTRIEHQTKPPPSMLGKPTPPQQYALSTHHTCASQPLANHATLGLHNHG